MLHQTRVTGAVLVALAAIAVAGAAPPAPSASDAKPPAAAPVKQAVPAAIKLVPITDKSYGDLVLKPLKGKAVFVSFWASYCGPCLAELPKLLEVKAAMQKAGGDVVLINVDPPGHPDAITKVLQGRGITLASTLQVDNEDPQPFIEAVDKSWMGEVPFGALYAKDGSLKKTVSGEQKPVDVQQWLTELAKAP